MNLHFLVIESVHFHQLRKDFGSKRRGFDSLKVEVVLGEQHWQTSIFADTSAEVYLLPVKAQVRKKEGLELGDLLKFQIKIL